MDRACKPRMVVLGVCLALSVHVLAPLAAAPPPMSTPPLRSQQALDDYLRDHSGGATPFDALPPGARERFFLSLRWGRGGLASLDTGILADELPQPGIDAILRLFGDELAGHAPASRLPAGVAVAPAGESTGELERRYNDFYRLLRKQGELDDAVLLGRLEERFDTIADAYAAGTLRQLDRRHLAMLWNAASLSARLSDSARYVDAMQAVLAETMRREAGSPPAHRLLELRNALLLARRFDDAQHLAMRHRASDLPALPAFVDPFLTDERPARSAWRLSSDGVRIERQALDLQGTRLVVTASYACGFSRNAAREIAADPELGPAFADRGTWLMLPPGAESIAGAVEWNRHFPQAPATLMYDRAEWPHLVGWQTPVFHVLHDGQVVETVVGWHDDRSRRDALVDMLRRHGLAEPRPPIR